MHRPLAPRGLADQPVGARKERHEKQGADQDHDDVDGDLHVAEASHIHEAVGVPVREGASHERLRHPRDRDQQAASQRRPRNAAARPPASAAVPTKTAGRAQTQLGQAGLGEDGTAHRDGQVRGQGRPDVGQDVAGEDPPPEHAGGARGQHVLLGQDAALERY